MRFTRKELTDIVLSMLERIKDLERWQTIYNLRLNNLEERLDIIKLNEELSYLNLKAYSCCWHIFIQDNEWNELNRARTLEEAYTWFIWYKHGLEDWTIIVELNEEETGICKEQMNCGCITKTATENKSKKSK